MSLRPETADLVGPRALSVSPSGFHAWLSRPRSVRARAAETLGRRIHAGFMASDPTSGARRVWHDLLAEGAACGLHRIERLMRIKALRAMPRRRRLPPDTGERPTAPLTANVRDRQFTASAPNQKWVANFTFIWIAEGCFMSPSRANLPVYQTSSRPDPRALSPR